MNKTEKTFFNINSRSENGFSGFKDLSNEILEFIDLMEKPMDILEEGAKEFVNDLMKLTKPMSEIKKSDYTHLINSFNYKKNKRKNEIEVGWGKYYGPMLEYGTSKMYAREHLNPVWSQNKDKYYNKMCRKMGIDPYFLY